MRLGVGRDPLPTAVFCGADDWAGGAMLGELLMIDMGEAGSERVRR